MIRKISILLTILIITAAFVSAQETPVCRCSEGQPCLVMTHSGEASSQSAERRSEAVSTGGSAAGSKSEAIAGGGTTTGSKSESVAEEGGAAGSKSEAISEGVTTGSKSEAISEGVATSSKGEAISEGVAASSKSEALSDQISSQIPEGIRNNEYFLKSVELSRQAQEAYNNGFYDGSTALAQEAIYYAELSDKYVTEQLIKEAKRLVDWADANSIEKRYPAAYTEGKTYYELSTEAQGKTEWNNAITAAIKSIEILGKLEANRSAPLPSQYTVRSWANNKDCLWTIAGYSFVYGDPWRWRELYNANRSRMPVPSNPNIIEPGFVIEIPSIQGEARHGMWDPSANYER